MKTTMKEAVNMYNALDKLSKEKRPLRMAYWITKNVHSLSPIIETFQSQRDIIYKDCLYANADGSLATKIDDNTYKFNIKDGKQDEWAKRFDELDRFEVEFEPYLLDLDALMASDPDFWIEPQLMTALMSLMKL